MGKRLKEARDRRVMTQDELSQLSGVPIVTISRIENERYQTRPAQRTIRKLAEALRVDPAWLMLGEEQAR